MIVLGYALIFGITLLVIDIKNKKNTRSNRDTTPRVIKTTHPENNSSFIEDIFYPVERIEYRETITFIMGEDDGDENYYSEAEKFHRLNPISIDESIVTSCKSLYDIRNYLEENRPENGEPWGIINIVVRTNEWKGLGIPLNTEEENISPKNILSSINNNTFIPLSDHIVDYETEIIIYGSSVGKNPLLLEMIAQAFGGNDIEQPLVYATNHFIHYESSEDDSRRYITESWNIPLSSNQQKINSTLKNKFIEKYPEDEVEWDIALEQTEPQFLGDVFYKIINIPIYETIILNDKNDFPTFSNDEEKEQWLLAQETAKNKILNTEIPIENFKWNITMNPYTFEDGKTKPLITIQGNSSILCIQRSMTTENYDDPYTPLPFEPALDDERFYSTNITLKKESVLSIND